ncbi:aspartate/glutamate racemase family protein [Candidatus Shapirobacteria bacterium]|nr:aspartate/glutamate racemase family protein [Candidatus Shapirobacteria bacterium]
MRKILPAYDYLYLGDNLHVPHGNRSCKEIIFLTRRTTSFFREKKCALVIFACNTATALALPTIQKEFEGEIKDLGIVRPTSEFLANHHFGKVGFIGTTNTIKTNIFYSDFKKAFPQKELVFCQNDCLGLVEEIEGGELEGENLKKILAACLMPLKKEKIDALVLGCTHYNLITRQIDNLMSEVRIITQGEIVAEKLRDYLKRHGDLEKKLSRRHSLDLYFTKDNPSYPFLVKTFLGEEETRQLKLAEIKL